MRDLGRVQREGARWLGDEVEPEAVLDVLPYLVEGGTAQHRRELTEHLREGEDLRRLVQAYDAAGRVRGRVESAIAAAIKLPATTGRSGAQF